MNVEKILLLGLAIGELLMHLLFLLQFKQEQFFFEATLLVLLFIIVFMGVFYLRNTQRDALPFFFVFFGMNIFNMLVFERHWIGSFVLEMLGYSISGLGILLTLHLQRNVLKEKKRE